MKLTVKSPVWDDLREIGLRITKVNPDAAYRFFRAAEDSFALLRKHPRIGRLRSFSVAGIRSWVIPEFQNFVIFYVTTETEVQILAVLRGSRDISSSLRNRLLT